MKIVTIGEILWDVVGNGEHLGGAPLNFSAALQRLGNSAILVSAVGDDARGKLALAAIRELGLSTQFVQTLLRTETGTAIVSKGLSGNASFFIRRPAAFDQVSLNEAQMAALIDLQPGWIYYGTLAQTHPPSLARLDSLLQRLPNVKRFYDMNLRKGHWDLPLVKRLSQDASVLKLNDDEAETLFGLVRPSETFNLESFARYWSKTYNIETICITLGGKGCAVFHLDALQVFQGFKVEVKDTVGAGDAFAAAFLHGQIQGWPMLRQAMYANALGALVASRSGAIPAWTVDEWHKMVDAVVV